MFDNHFSLSPSPFHAGEMEIQHKLGVREQAESLGQHMILDHVPEAHNQFYQQLPLLFVGVQDASQRPWATVLFGQPGFLHATDPKTLAINALPHEQDEVARYMHPGQAVGLLGLDFRLRRRSRLNGVIRHAEKGRALLDVQQCFVNCPKYIQSRLLSSVTFNKVENDEVYKGTVLSPEQITLIRQADTFFIASQYSAKDKDGSPFSLDLSHRGGKPGFVQVNEAGLSLQWPDFAGNNMFNTLGNIRHDPRAGLLFINYQSGDILNLTGEAEIVWQGPEVDTFAGAERTVRFHIKQWTHLKNAYTFDWSEAQLSPFLAHTGSW